MKTTKSMRLRVSRFCGQRYVQRERPNCFAEFALFGVVVITAFWPILSLANAMAGLR